MDVAIHPGVAFVDTTVANLPEEQDLYFARVHRSSTYVYQELLSINFGYTISRRSYDAQKWTKWYKTVGNPMT